MPLFGRKILITGGTQGLGRAMAFEFAARRAEVVLTGRDLDRAREVAGAVAQEVTETRKDAGEPRVMGLACEVTDLDSVRAAVMRRAPLATPSRTWWPTWARAAPMAGSTVWTQKSGARPWR